MLADRLGEVLRDGVAQRLLAGRGDADAGLEHAARRLAGAEPGQADLAGDLAERLVDVLVELGLVDVDRQLDLVALEGLHRALHRASEGIGRCHGAPGLGVASRAVGALRVDPVQVAAPAPRRLRHRARPHPPAGPLPRASTSPRSTSCRAASRSASVARSSASIIAPRNGVPNLEVMVSDGTGTITAVFAGRRRIAGIEHGRAIVLEGVAVDLGDRAVIYNPAYTLVP